MAQSEDTNPFPPTEAEWKQIRQILKNLPCADRRRLGRLVYALDNADLETILSDVERNHDREWKHRAIAAWVVGQIPIEDAELRTRTIARLRTILRDKLKSSPRRLGERTFVAYLRTLLFLFPVSLLFAWLSLSNRPPGEEMPLNEFIPSVLLATCVMNLIGAIGYVP